MAEGTGTCSTVRTAQACAVVDTATSAIAAMSASRPIRRLAEGIHPIMHLAQDRKADKNSYMLMCSYCRRNGFAKPRVPRLVPAAHWPDAPVVSAVDPDAMLSVVDDAAVAEIAGDPKKRLRTVIDEAAKITSSSRCCLPWPRVWLAF